MPKSGTIVLRCGGMAHVILLSQRDVHLLDGQHFFKGGWGYRRTLGLDFIRGLSKVPKINVPLLRCSGLAMLPQLQGLLVELETQRDLISFDYSYSFEDEPKYRRGGATSGFVVEGGTGSVDVRPAGYCDLTVMGVGPNGRGRIITVVDLRVRRDYQTLARGKLRVHRRKAAVGWFDQLDEAINFLKHHSAETIELIHAE